MKIDPSIIYNKYQATGGEPLKRSKIQSGLGESLKVGAQFKGELVDVSRSKVTIRLIDGQVLNAALEGASNFAIGDAVAFLVKEASPRKLVLTAVTEGMPEADKILSLLTEAGLEAEEDHVALVKAMMAEKLPVDTASLKQMVRWMNSNPEATVKELVFLAKHNIPVTEGNITQLKQLQSNEQPLMRAMASLVDDLAKVVTEATGEGPISENTSGTDGEKAILTTLTQDPKLPGFIKDMTALSHNPNVSLTAEGQPTMEEMLPREGIKRLEGRLVQQLLQNQPASLSEAQEGLLKELKPFEGMTLTDLEQLAKASLITHEQLRSFLSGVKENALYQGLAKGLLLSDIKTVEEGQIKAYFNEVQEKVAILLRDNPWGEEGQEVGKNAAEVKGSVDFMNTLQQDYSFLHLPMFLNDQLLQSELYVLNNTPAGKEGKRSITALVRLDMRNLGHTDIYVKKVDKNIDIQFYMAEESQVSPLQKEVRHLHKALKNKGFNILSVTVQTLGADFDLVKDFLEKDGKPVDTKRFSFDMRA